MTNRRRPRVFHLITRLLKGGAEAKTIETVCGLEEYDFTVGYGASYDREQVNRLEDAGIETKCFSLIRHYNLITALPAVGSLARYLQRNEFDIVHTHSTEAGIIGRFAAAIAGVPRVVHTVHGVPFADDRNDILTRFVLACERLAAHYTDRIVTNAEIMAEEYLEYGIGKCDQYTTIYSGIDLDSFRNVSATADLPGVQPRVVMIGRLADGKGFDVMLDAAESVCDEDISICLVGDGPLYDSLERQIDERGLSDCVFLTGFREDIPHILAASDVLVLPSFREGTPRVITEAMGAGLPVVATNIAGIPEQVKDGETGYLIPTGDPDALAERLSELLADEQLRDRMGERAVEQAQQFSVSTMLSDLDDLYRHLLRE